MFNRCVKKNILAILLALVSLFSILLIPSQGAVAQTEKGGKTINCMEIDAVTVPFSTPYVLSNDNVYVYHNGFMFDAIKSPAMAVWHFPKNAEVRLNIRVWQNYSEFTGTLYFRIVHEHVVQEERVNEIIFPADGSWFNVTENAPNMANAKVIGDYVKVSAGDKIKMICVAMGSDSYCTTYIENGIKFIYDGGPASGLNLYANDSRISNFATGTPVTLTPELADFYGSGTSDKVITYHEITKYIDVFKTVE